MNKVKKQGQVYTPLSIVKLMLDSVGYEGCKILKKHIIDNSCGDGAFLTESVFRYCNEYFQSKNSDLKKLKKDLESYIHGIEIDEIEYKKCLENLNAVGLKFGLSNVKWNVLNRSALEVNVFNHQMDYVVGNPPYVRVHNLEQMYESVKKFQFAQEGMTDLYIVFFEICFELMNDSGVMCVITPSSWLNSLAGTKLRNYILENKNLKKLIDLEHYQAFNATTYTIISQFNKKENDAIFYYTYDGKLHKKENLSYANFVIDGKFYLASKKDLDLLHKIRNSNLPCRVQVKNGFATLADKIFIGNFEFEDCVIDVIKASSGKWTKCVYPYNAKGKPFSELEFQKFKKAYSYLLLHKENISSHGDGSAWFLFGRSQGVLDVKKNKIAINSLIKDIDTIKLNEVPAGKGVYSGLYILTEFSFEKIKSILQTEDFVEYISLLKNYKSGGYYTYSSKDLEMYLNYKLSGEKYE